MVSDPCDKVSVPLPTLHPHSSVAATTLNTHTHKDTQTCTSMHTEQIPSLLVSG